MIETHEFKGYEYPKPQTEAFAAKYAFPFAEHYCKGVGYDIGCSRKEWALPGSIPIDPNLKTGDGYHAMNLPSMSVNFIFSSHMLEHYEGDWREVLDYWKTRLHPKGVLFLYLPHPYQEIWLPENQPNNHFHSLNQAKLLDYFYKSRWNNIFVTPGHDLNHSFYAMAEKR